MGPPQSAASGRRRLDRRRGRHLGRAAASGGLSRREWTRTRVRLQPIHRHDLLPLAHLDGESLRSSGDHQVWGGIWGRQRLLLAANPHVHILRLG